MDITQLPLRRGHNRFPVEDEATVAIAPQTAPTQGFNLGIANLFDNEYSSTQKFVMLEPRPMIRG
ncbi:MAG: hypothetical protein AAGD09_26090 [Cyanobacteria bacterium P01_F01_bin.56]